ncbi:hypothetical protein TNCV_3125741 [Trichonephila clavipes]|nr:hypothetical protein TNCV_3125741 [Trichonephila clavipes]
MHVHHDVWMRPGTHVQGCPVTEPCATHDPPCRLSRPFWHGVDISRGRCRFMFYPRHLTRAQNYEVCHQQPSCGFTMRGKLKEMKFLGDIFFFRRKGSTDECISAKHFPSSVLLFGKMCIIENDHTSLKKRDSRALNERTSIEKSLKTNLFYKARKVNGKLNVTVVLTAFVLSFMEKKDVIATKGYQREL